MKNKLFILYLVVTGIAQAYVIYDLYAALFQTYNRQLATYEYVQELGNRFEFIESTVNHHDEFIQQVLMPRQERSK